MCLYFECYLHTFLIKILIITMAFKILFHFCMSFYLYKSLFFSWKYFPGKNAQIFPSGLDSILKAWLLHQLIRRQTLERKAITHNQENACVIFLYYYQADFFVVAEYFILLYRHRTWTPINFLLLSVKKCMLPKSPWLSKDLLIYYD